MAKYMEISMYLAMCFIARYMEISMYLAIKHMARYMEISMYVAKIHRYITQSTTSSYAPLKLIALLFF